MPSEAPSAEDKETWGSEGREIKKPVEPEEAKLQVPQEEQGKARIERGKITEQEHAQAEKQAQRLLQRNGVPGEKETQKTMEEFLRDIIYSDQALVHKDKEKELTKDKLIKTNTPLHDQEINSLILAFNDQFIQTNKDKFTDQNQEMP